MLWICKSGFVTCNPALGFEALQISERNKIIRPSTLNPKISAISGAGGGDSGPCGCASRFPGLRLASTRMFTAYHGRL